MAREAARQKRDLLWPGGLDPEGRFGGFDAFLFADGAVSRVTTPSHKHQTNITSAFCSTQFLSPPPFTATQNRNPTQHDNKTHPAHSFTHPLPPVPQTGQFSGTDVHPGMVFTAQTSWLFPCWEGEQKEQVVGLPVQLGADSGACGEGGNRKWGWWGMLRWIVEEGEEESNLRDQLQVNRG